MVSTETITTCAKCNYSMDDLHDGVCPQCGSARRAVPMGGWGLWVLGLIPLGAFTLLFGAGAVLIEWQPGDLYANDRAAKIASTALAVGFGLATLGWLWLRFLVRRLPRRVQLLLVGVAWIGGAIVALAFGGS